MIARKALTPPGAYENSIGEADLHAWIAFFKSEIKASSVQLRNAKLAMRAHARAACSASEREAVSAAQSALHHLRLAAYLRHSAYGRLLQRRYCLRMRTHKRALVMSQSAYWCFNCDSSYEDHYPKLKIQENENEQQ